MNKGTAAGVRARGFTLPAAGKTGTSRDGWFAGFTNNLVCVIWIGFDDNRDFGLPGGTAAAPIWADFMIRATSLPAYKDVKDFPAPEGVQTVSIDPESLELSTPNCPATREEVYVAGSAPTQILRNPWRPQYSVSSTGSWLSHVFGGGDKDKKKRVDANGQPQPYDPNRPPNATGQGQLPTVDANGKPIEKKKNPLQKIFGIFGGKKKQDPDKNKPDNKGDSP